MADNYVSIAIKATDEGAEADIDALKARLDELKAKRAEIEVDVNDKDGVARLTKLDSQIEALSAKVAKPKISLAGAARAEADLAALDLGMDRLKEKLASTAAESEAAAAVIGGGMDRLKEKADKEDAASGGKGLLSRMMVGGGSGGGLSGFLSNVPVLGSSLEKVAQDLGNLGQEGGSAGEALGSLGKSAPVAAGAVVAVGAAAGAALAEVDALATGLLAAGLGVGGFAALALPAFSKVTTAYSQINADQKAYDDALTKSAKNTALKKLHQDLKDLDPAERGAVGGLQNLMNTFHKMSQAFEPTAFKVFNQGLGIANQLLPYVAKFANAAAPAIEHIMQALSKDIKSKGFKDFMDRLAQISPAAITAIGNGLLGLAGAASKLFTIFSKKDVVTGIDIAFGVLKGTVNGVVGTINFFRESWDKVTGVFHRVSSATSGMRSSWSKDWAAIRKAAAPVISEIKKDLGSLTSWWNAHWTQIHAVLSATWSAIKVSVSASMAAVTAAVKIGISIIGGAWRTGWDLVKDTVKTAWDLVSGIVRAGVAVIEGVIKVAGDIMKGHWSAAWHDMTHYAGQAVSAIGQTISRVSSDFGTLLYDAGKNVVQGLVNGIRSAIGAVGGAMSSIAGEIRSYLPFSPAKKGPLSGSGAPDLSGKKIAAMLAEGVDSGRDGVSGAAGRLARAVQSGTRLTAGAGHLAGASGGTVKVQLELTGGTDAMARALRQMIRVKGGNVQKVLGSSAS